MWPAFFIRIQSNPLLDIERLLRDNLFQPAVVVFDLL